MRQRIRRRGKKRRDGLTKQRRYVLRKKEAGICANCTNLLRNWRELCNECNDKRRERVRRLRAKT